MSPHFTRDFLASIVIFLVALPLNLGIALASGASPVTGILSGVVAGIVVGTLAGCPLQVSGPAVGLIAIVWQIVNTHGISLLGPVVLTAGLLQIALGLGRYAPYVRAAAPSVMQGMLAGIAVLIFASQFQVILSQSPKVSGLANLIDIPSSVLKALTGRGSLVSALLGFFTIGAIIAWSRVPRRLKSIPGPLVGVVVAAAVASLFSLDVQRVDVPTDGLPNLISLDWKSLEAVFSLQGFGFAVILALVATAETVHTATMVERMHEGPKTDYNREAIAQGVGNLICGFYNLLPVSGVIVRSGINVEAGATSRLSSVLHGVWVALVLLYSPSILSYIPLTSLAAVLVYTSYRLFDINAIRGMQKFDQSELAIYALTLVSVVTVDLLSGIVLGFAASAAKLVFKLTRRTVSMDRRETRATLEQHPRDRLVSPHQAK